MKTPKILDPREYDWHLGLFKNASNMRDFVFNSIESLAVCGVIYFYASKNGGVFPWAIFALCYLVFIVYFLAGIRLCIIYRLSDSNNNISKVGLIVFYTFAILSLLFSAWAMEFALMEISNFNL
jgi:hypothetical protein